MVKVWWLDRVRELIVALRKYMSRISLKRNKDRNESVIRLIC